MAELFEQTSINNITLANRFVRSATWEGMASEEGAATSRLAELMVQLVRGNVGLIISSHAYVSKEGQAGPWQLGAYSDHLLPGLQDMVQKVHAEGGKIILQLAHAGCKAAANLSGLQPVGPSPGTQEKGQECREMSQAEIGRTVDAFAQAALLGQRAGFDGVQIHAAHGYLLSQFLSPYYNKRTDEYGGSVQNRSRIVMEVLKAIQVHLGKDYPVMIKINSEDYLEPGLSVEDMLLVASMLEENGISAIELSGGTGDSGKFIPPRKASIKTREDEVYYFQAAKKFKEKINVPLMLVGGIRSYEVARDLVQNNLADYISLSRPLIREPNLVSRWKSGDTRPSPCESDNLCFKPILKGEGMYCLRKEKEKEKTT